MKASFEALSVAAVLIGYLTFLYSSYLYGTGDSTPATEEALEDYSFEEHNQRTSCLQPSAKNLPQALLLRM